MKTLPADARMRWPANDSAPHIYLGAAGRFDVYWYPHSGVAVARWGPGEDFARVRRGRTTLSIDPVQGTEEEQALVELLIETFGGAP